jgi:multidrug resistance efflux pump
MNIYHEVNDMKSVTLFFVIILLLLGVYQCLDGFYWQSRIYGTINSDNKQVVTALLATNIEKIHVHPFQQVHRGDLLLTLRADTSQVKMNENLLDYVVAYKQWQLEQKRLQDTAIEYQLGAVAKKNYQDEQYKFEATTLVLQSKLYQFNLLKSMLDPTNKIRDVNLSSHADLENIIYSMHYNLLLVRAPMDGVVYFEKELHSGMYIEANSSLMHIASSQDLIVTASITAENARRITANTHARIRVSNPSCELIGDKIIINPYLRSGRYTLRGDPLVDIVIKVTDLTACSTTDVLLGKVGLVSLMDPG